MARPQYRLRVGDVRVFYDATAESVEALAIVPESAATIWLEQFGKPNKKSLYLRSKMIFHDFCARRRSRSITRHGKPAGVLIGFESEDDWFDYKLENDPRFLERVEQARRSLKAGRGTQLQDMPK